MPRAQRHRSLIPVNNSRRGILISSYGSSDAEIEETEVPDEPDMYIIGRFVPYVPGVVKTTMSMQRKAQIRGDAINSAKNKFRLYLTCDKSFPNREEGITKAVSCISETLSEYPDTNEVDPGFWQEHMDAMAVDVYDDASTFHMELQTSARRIVKLEYDIFVPIGVGHNSLEALHYTADCVELYLEHGKFLRGEELDAKGRTKNIQHKAIGALVQEFYHQEMRMGLLFPDVFGESTPNCAVSLVCCAIMCCLQEWETGEQLDMPFTLEAFSRDNDEILDLIAEVEANSYHGFSYQNAKKRWASGNAYSPGPGREQVTRRKFEAILD